MFTRRSKLCREDYKPHKVETNLENGVWTLSSQIKRHGFVDILEEGEKIGLVMCSTCRVTCSKNSFRKIRTHECGKSSPEHGSKSRKYLERMFQAKHRPMFNDLQTTSSPLFPIPLHLQQPERQIRSSPLKNNFKAERMNSETFTPPIEEVLSKMVGNIQQSMAENQFHEQQERPSSPVQTPPPRISPPIQLPKQLESIPVNGRMESNGKSNNSDGDSLCNMVNSTYRTLSAQNRRLAIEFKCCIMNLISEYEMMMLDKEGQSNSSQ